MKNQHSSHHMIYILLAVWVIAITALTLTACGQTAPTAATSDTTASTQLQAPTSFDADVHIPAVRIRFMAGRNQYSAELTRGGTYSWTLPAGKGMMQTVHADGYSPDQLEELCTIAAQSEDGMVTLELPENALSYRVMRRFVRDDTEFPLREMASTDGRFALEEGTWYYEITVTYPEGEATYGFEAYYSAEFSSVTKQRGCEITTISHEDPDIKFRKGPGLLSISHEQPDGITSGLLLRPDSYYGFEWTNHAGTVIRTERSAEEYAASNPEPNRKVYEYDTEHPLTLIFQFSDIKTMTMTCADDAVANGDITLPAAPGEHLIIRDGKAHDFRVSMEYADGSTATYTFSIVPKPVFIDEDAMQ